MRRADCSRPRAAIVADEAQLPSWQLVVLAALYACAILLTAQRGDYTQQLQ
jgi:hypothetical protein